MRWIKYQIVQCTVDEKDILATKKVEYSDANLAIAQGEAYNGEYTIVEDEKSFDKKPLGIEFGGTNGKSAEEARTNLNVYSKEEAMPITAIVFVETDPGDGTVSTYPNGTLVVAP